jgi:uncharacterized protein YvpB
MIKLIDAAEHFKNLPHQREALEWLQKQSSDSVLEEFGKQYRNAPKPYLEFPNTWDGVLAAAKKAGAKFPECVAAQWHLESAQGQHTSCTHNYFGIKSKDGEGCHVTTTEFIGGKEVTIKDWFKKFDSLYGCVEYLVNRWYKDFEAYKGVNCATSRNECANLLVKEKYATDPSYATKLIQIMDQRLKTPGSEPSSKQNPLPVIYMSQRDNYRDASRTCFSSSCAMMLKFLKPTSIKNDDDYIRTVFSFGDSTDSGVQLAALKHYGITAKFTTQGSRDLIKKQIDAGKPVPAGFLHHGNVKNPQGSGHYLCIIGYNSEGYWVHDPWGDCNLIDGTYNSTNGKKLHYSYKNFEPRWLVEGPKSGWCIIA